MGPINNRLYVTASPTTQVINNVVLSNTAAVTGGLGYGGGLTLSGSSETTVAGNRVEHNVAQAGLAPSFGSDGGGIRCWNSDDVVFSDNVVQYNIIVASNVASYQGGGLAFETDTSQPITGTLSSTPIPSWGRTRCWTGIITCKLNRRPLMLA